MDKKYTLIKLESIPTKTVNTDHDAYYIKGIFKVNNNREVNFNIGLLDIIDVTFTYNTLDCIDVFTYNGEEYKTDNAPIIIEKIIDILLYKTNIFKQNLIKEVKRLKNVVEMTLFKGQSLFETAQYNYTLPKEYSELNEITNKIVKMNNSTLNDGNVLLRVYAAVYGKICNKNYELFSKAIGGTYKNDEKETTVKIVNDLFPKGFYLAK